MKLSTVFRRLDRLYSDPRRWISGSYSSTVGPRKLQCFCLAGGVNKIIGADSTANADSTLPGKALLVAIKELHPRSKRTKSVESWNDTTHRTIQEIRVVVRKALKNAVKAEARA